ncbi:hypothetical protein V6N12_003327 [Hibiscus sabdariffa]|uniref:Uncharacterized protein n=1 Tax=Hibiscus sabdariffa TaxID=183260 RepID=A0ABR2EBI5_9ROSI
MRDVDDASAKQKEPLQPDMGGKVADTSNLETLEGNNIVLSMCSAPKNINELAIDATTKGNNVLGTERDLNHKMVDLGPAAYPSPFGFGEQSKQETKQSNSLFGNMGVNAK